MRTTGRQLVRLNRTSNVVAPSITTIAQSRQIMDLASVKETTQVCIENIHLTTPVGYGGQIFSTLTLCVAYVGKVLYEKDKARVEAIDPDKSRLRKNVDMTFSKYDFGSASCVALTISSSVGILTGDIGVLLPGLFLTNLSAVWHSPKFRALSTLSSGFALTVMLMILLTE